MSNFTRSMRALPLALVFVVAASTAFAADVVVPVGEWISQIMPAIRDLVIAIAIAGIGFLSRNLPAAVGDAIRMLQVEQLLKRAVDYGIAATAGATKGKTLTVPIANEVIAAALQYAVDQAPRLSATLGGNLEAKIIARLGAHPDVKLPVEASAANLGTGPQ